MDASPTTTAAAGPAVRYELLEADREAIAAAVEHANPMVLRGLLYQLTADEELLATRAHVVQGGVLEMFELGADDAALVRRKAIEFLMNDRDAGAGPLGSGPVERLRTSLGLAVGKELRDEDMAYWIEQTALDPWARSLTWQQEPTAEKLAGFSVTVIGAGMGGLNVALQLRRAGIACTVVEKNADVGGTWFENRYPGARVDTPSRAYTHTYGVDFPYPYSHCPWTENLKYFEWVADTFDLRGDITFDTEVRSLTWHEEDGEWEVVADGPDGTSNWRSSAVVTSVGFLNRPRIPEIEGQQDFRGPAWHTAHWPEDADLAGKRVAVIGSGCSGYQLVPELALEAGHVTMFQRTASWLFQAPGYRSPFPPEVNWLDRNLPYYTNFLRFLAHYPLTAEVPPVLEIDPDFDDPHALSPVNKVARDLSVAFLEEKLRDPDLVAKMTPDVPVLSSRPVTVDPEYSVLDALLRDNVSLVTEGIRRITATGIEAGDGTHHALDVIVYATGFHAANYMFPMEITGRDGQTLEQLWSHDGARAFLGCMMPGFPNFWSLYGPNTNGGLQPADFFELTTGYALQCMERLILDDKKAIEVTADAYWRYNERLDERGSHMAWSDPRARSYYTSEYGRSITNCPLAGTEIWQLLHRPDFDDLTVR